MSPSRAQATASEYIPTDQLAFIVDRVASSSAIVANSRRASSSRPASAQDLDELYARLDETEANAVNLPHRHKYLLLVIGFLRRLLELHEALVDDVERELGPKTARRSRAAQ